MSTNVTTKSGEAFRVVIPARYASNRLPGKPLRMLGSRPLIGHVYENARRSGAGEVVVATDDTRIIEYIEETGGAARMTSPGCVSGSDRVAEIAEAMQWPDDSIVVNVQGDEPFLSPQDIADAAAALAGYPGASIATLSVPLADEHRGDANVVKVITDDNGVALQFSRSFIECAREWRHHLGIYAYRCGYLRRFTRLQAPEIERRERLEQLRALCHGDIIYVREARSVAVPSIDTESDLLEAIKFLEKKNSTKQ